MNRVAIEPPPAQYRVLLPKILTNQLRFRVSVLAVLATVGGCASGPLAYTPPPTAPVASATRNDTPVDVQFDTAAPSPSKSPLLVRGQDPYNGAPSGYGSGQPGNGSFQYGNGPNAANGYGANGINGTTPGSNSQPRYPMPASGGERASAPYDYGQPSRTTVYQPPPENISPPIGSGVPYGQPGAGMNPGAAFDPFGAPPVPQDGVVEPPQNFADLIVQLQEAQTGRFQFGVGINSDAGVTGQIVIDERNFDWRRPPSSFQDWVNGTAFRGAGQGFRLEAMPGTQVQRYMVSFTEPYLFGYSPISLSLSGFFYNRRFFDWDEERLGGRMALGYRLTPNRPDLSVSGALRAESVDISRPRVVGVPELDKAVGRNSLYSGRVTVVQDTRDMPFFPTAGDYLELAYEQVFGSFDYPRAEADYRKYFLVRERPDGSGRHTLAFSFRLGFSGSQTPIYENYFSGGYSTMRGFNFRGASPVDQTVVVGGRSRFLGSVEYFFPLTADDMIKGVVFCDFGTTERNIHIDWDNYRVAPGFGLRLNIPALGPAPLAIDVAIPIAHAPTDNIQNVSFFMGFGR